MSVNPNDPNFKKNVGMQDKQDKSDARATSTEERKASKEATSAQSGSSLPPTASMSSSASATSSPAAVPVKKYSQEEQEEIDAHARYVLQEGLRNITWLLSQGKLKMNAAGMFCMNEEDVQDLLNSNKGTDKPNQASAKPKGSS